MRVWKRIRLNYLTSITTKTNLSKHRLKQHLKTGGGRKEKKRKKKKKKKNMNTKKILT